MDVFIYFVVFVFGYLFCDYVTEQKRQELLKASTKIFEINSYVVLGELSTMHEYGLKALSLAYEKCLEIDQTQKEEYEQFIKVFDSKMEEFGDMYMKNLKKSLTFKIKYNTYKEVKEYYKTLINNSQEDK